MKILMTLSIVALGALLPENAPSVKADDVNVNAFSLVNYQDPNDPNDDLWAYFDKKACADAFQATHPGYVKGGIKSVPAEQVFTNCQL